ncbi:HAD domain-containing protein [Stenotrophomonas maltophilia]|uniref:HAD domain-containing protein n=1 Tax=Stenotrophomonas maltophilia TaxID=40324 RepID=UPI0039C21345
MLSKLAGLLRAIGLTAPQSNATAPDVEQSPWRGPRPGAVVVFVDVDGVLHRAENGSLEFAPVLTRVLLACPHADVVFSTNWRINASWEYLVNLLPPEVQDRVAGVTGVVEGQRFERELECMEYAEKHGVLQFVAVDDNATLFLPGCHFLFRADRYDGLNDEAGARLSTWINFL